MISDLSFKKYLVVNAASFSLAGLLWGLILYNRLPDLEYPFHYAAFLILAVLGGLSLMGFIKNVKEVLKSVLAGVLGYGVGFTLGGVFIYPLYLIGIYLLGSIPFFNNLLGEKFYELIRMTPNITVGGFWLVFLVIGAFVGLSYSLFLKIKVWPMIWRGGVGFALGSLIGPIIGNLVGNAFNSLLIAYLISFAILAAVLGKFLAWGAYKNKKE